MVIKTIKRRNKFVDEVKCVSCGEIITRISRDRKDIQYSFIVKCKCGNRQGTRKSKEKGKEFFEL